MQQIFTNELLNKSFLENGFVKLQLLDEVEVTEILAAIKKNYINLLDSNETLNVSLWSNNLELKIFADNLIKRHLAKKLESILVNYEAIWGDIIIKKPHFTKTFGLHQDWTFVDENKSMSVNVWCALQDVNYWNGCLQVVPKSHVLIDEIRGLNIVPSYSSYRNEIEKKYAVNVEVKKGEAILFSHALLHASSPNRSLKNRICIGLNLKPKNEPITHFILDTQTNKIKKYHVINDYFINIGTKTNFSKSIKTGFRNTYIDGILIDEFEHKKEPFSIKDFSERIKKT